MPLRERINELLKQLAYPALEDNWNFLPNPVTTASSEAAKQLETLLARMQAADWEFDIDSIAIIADDNADLRWVIEPHSSTVRRGDGEVDFVLAGATEDLVRMLLGQDNIGGLIRTGRIRRLPKDAEFPGPDVPRMIKELVARFAG